MALVADGFSRVSADRTCGPAAADFGDDLANIIVRILALRQHSVVFFREIHVPLAH